MVLSLDLIHDWSADFASSGSSLALTNAVVVQNTSTAQTMRGSTVLVAALLHVLPQSHHLSAELGLAVGAFLAFGSMAEEK